MSQDAVVEILRNALQLEDDFTPTDNMLLEEIPNLDSMGRVRMVMEIERVLDDRLTMEEIIAIESVGHIRTLLLTKGKLPVQG